MTLTAEQSSNKARYEAAPTAEIIDIIRTAMSQGCIRPCHVYDAVDELICRIQALENRPKRNCDRPECATTKAAQDVWRKEDGGKTAYYEWLLATAKEGGKNGNE